MKQIERREHVLRARANLVGGTMPGVDRNMPITAQNTMSDTTRGLVRLKNWRRRKPPAVEAICIRGNFITLALRP